MRTFVSMHLSDTLFLLSGIASIISFYIYQKEKRGLREFMQHSRRHMHHKTVDMAMQKKASRYLALSITFFLISLLGLSVIFLK